MRSSIPMRIPSVLCLAVFASAAVCTAQNASTQATPASTEPVGTLHIQAQEVVLPVTVRDKHGELVTTLQKSDFTLTDNGHAQVIKSFTRETNLPFRIGLLVDTSRSMSAALPSVRTATGQFIDLMLPAAPTQSKDQAFLLHFDREVELLQDFTNSREKLDGELTDLAPTSGERYETQSSGNGNDGDNNGNGGDNNGNGGGQSQHRSGGGTTLYDAIYLASNDLMKPKDGRKALVIFSDGADRGSKETLNDAVDAADRANVAVYTIYFKGEEERNNNGGFPGGRHGGGFPGGGGGWPGGGGGWPGGGRSGGGQQPRSATGIDGKKIMREIADRTGGHAFEAKKKEDLEAIYKLIEQELRNQYLLTYTPDKLDDDGSFHKIALKANNGDLTVETREGYYAPGGDQ
jgi:VWFA-related protein